MAGTAGIYALETAALTHAAPGRRLNEDRYLLDHPGESRIAVGEIGRVFAVIDGVSAGGRGGLAAQATLETLQGIPHDARAFPLRPDLLEYKLLASNDLVKETVGGRCAATAVWIWASSDHDEELTAYFAHVGDTRLYHRSSGSWSAATRDGSSGATLLRAIGDGTGLVVDTGMFSLQPGDWVILASDGVWKRASPTVPAVLSGCRTTAEAAKRLVGTARINGSLDDVTVVVVRVFSRSCDDGAGEPPES